jgi:hypothetical protein
MSQRIVGALSRKESAMARQAPLLPAPETAFWDDGR